MGGPAKRVWRLDRSKIRTVGDKGVAEVYDAAVASAAITYGKKMHNLLFDNCHSHVALVLNELEYDRKRNWNMVRVFVAIWCRGRWVSAKDAVVVLLPVALVVLIAVVGGILAAFL